MKIIELISKDVITIKSLLIKKGIITEEEYENEYKIIEMSIEKEKDNLMI